MRLSIESDRDDDRSVAVIHAALDAGVDVLDTADVYALDAGDVGHNERLIARSLREWRARHGRDHHVIVATKGGLRRPGGRWVPDGRASHLVAACEASCRALGVDRIALYQLHAVDPRTPLATSVRALARLQREGLVGAVGLCNVTLRQLQEAAAFVDVATVQVELSLWHDDALLNGVVEYCLAREIPVLAYRPLGGRRRKAQVNRDPVLTGVASRHGVSPFDIALAAIRDLSPLIVPLPGPSRVETAMAIRRSLIALRDVDRDDLQRRFGRRRDRGVRAPMTGTASVSATPAAGEVVLVIGMPGAGKSTYAEPLAAAGYRRLNRDDEGGTLSDLLPRLDRLLQDDAAPVVLDNTYAKRQARARVIRVAQQRGRAVRCVWLRTSLEEAQTNAVHRLVRRYGRLLMPEELAAARAQDVAAFLPGTLFRYHRDFEPPETSEGFSSVEVVDFERRYDSSCEARALVVSCDDVLVRSRSGRRAPVSADDVEVRDARASVLRQAAADGWRLLGLAWRPEIAAGAATAADVAAVFAEVQRALGVEIDIAWCPHPAGPPVCWCRRPLPGLGVAFTEKYRLDPRRCVCVGDGAHDAGFARRLGFTYRAADEFFGD